jgi:aspartyl-tRNA(Asn)/glutamyl-tRNA(Gln) amidotransferase subunit C
MQTIRLSCRDGIEVVFDTKSASYASEKRRLFLIECYSVKRYDKKQFAVDTLFQRQRRGVAVAAEEIDVAYVAQLATIRLTDEEARLFQRQLPVILAYVDKLRRLDVSGIEPTSHGQPVYNVLRDDVPEPGLDSERVLANAPARLRDTFKVPRIVES